MAQSTYVPGVYTTSLMLNQNAIDVEVVVDENHINSVRLINISDAVTTMFPLVEPSFDSIAGQIYEGVSLDAITFDEDSRYTSQVLIQAIQASLDKATNGSSTVSGSDL